MNWSVALKFKEYHKEKHKKKFMCVPQKDEKVDVDPPRMDLKEGNVNEDDPTASDTPITSLLVEFLSSRDPLEHNLVVQNQPMILHSREKCRVLI